MLTAFTSRWEAFRRLQLKLGFIPAIRYVGARLLLAASGASSVRSRNNLYERCSYLQLHPFGDTNIKIPADEKTINWVVPDFGVGSGGHLNIFRMVYFLESFGYECRIIIDGPCTFGTGDDARTSIRQHFFPIESMVSLGWQSLKPAWATIATSWPTAYTVRNFMATRGKHYFIQDFEPAFYPAGSEYCLAEETYRFGFNGITAGNWLAQIMEKRYGMHAESFGFAVDKSVYKPQIRPPDRKRIFFYARPVTPRRGFELGLFALLEVARRRPDVEIVLAGWNLKGYSFPRNFVPMGILPLNEVSPLMSRCDIALILSMTNVSLLPLEAMACGCAVVSNRGEGVEWLLNDNISLLAEPRLEALVDAVILLLEDDARRHMLAENGKRFASNTDWRMEALKVADIMERARGSA